MSIHLYFRFEFKKMPKPNEVESNVVANVKPEEIAGIVAKLRASFNTDKTRSKSWRVSQLNALNRMLTEGRDELARSLFDDMHCSPFEGKIDSRNRGIFSTLTHLLHSIHATARDASTRNL